ncbi:hypothetical protein C4588_01640 [Candidatus Parcubacteria bacterium]|nr:MAG: hypothetical protein C4588_01640 [Candidatus Parcubacteria bacterium]
MENPREAVFNAITEERNYQDRKWGTVKDRPHSIAEWILIAEAELEEAKHAWTKDCSDLNALKELLQVAAVVVAALEQHQIKLLYHHWYTNNAESTVPLYLQTTRHYSLAQP